MTRKHLEQAAVLVSTIDSSASLPVNIDKTKSIITQCSLIDFSTVKNNEFILEDIKWFPQRPSIFLRQFTLQ